MVLSASKRGKNATGSYRERSRPSSPTAGRSSSARTDGIMDGEAIAHKHQGGQLIVIALYQTGAAVQKKGLQGTPMITQEHSEGSLLIPA